MDIVLGVSVTTTTVRMVLIEGEKADGVIIEYSTFDTADGVVKASPSEQISAAILATQQNAASKGHHLVLSGVTWDDELASADVERRPRRSRSSERGAGGRAERRRRVGPDRRSRTRLRHHSSDGDDNGDCDVVGRRQRRRVDCGSADVHPRRRGCDRHPAGDGGSLGSPKSQARQRLCDGFKVGGLFGEVEP